jgi:hypothetical protein
MDAADELYLWGVRGGRARGEKAPKTMDMDVVPS